MKTKLGHLEQDHFFCGFNRITCRFERHDVEMNVEGYGPGTIILARRIDNHGSRELFFCKDTSASPDVSERYVMAKKFSEHLKQADHDAVPYVVIDTQEKRLTLWNGKDYGTKLGFLSNGDAVLIDTYTTKQ